MICNCNKDNTATYHSIFFLCFCSFHHNNTEVTDSWSWQGVAGCELFIVVGFGLGCWGVFLIQSKIDALHIVQHIQQQSAI